MSMWEMEDNGGSEVTVAADSAPRGSHVTLYLAPPEAKAFAPPKVGTEITLVLKGKVVEYEVRNNNGQTLACLELDLTSVKGEGGSNVFADLAADD